MAEYDFKKKPALTTKEGETEVYYPEIVTRGKITRKELIKRVAEHSTFSAGELEGVLGSLIEAVSEYIGDGYRVELGDFGVFTGKIKAPRMVTDKKDIRATSMSFDGVSFRASKRFRSMATGDLSRAESIKFRHSSELSEEQRKELLMEHLKKNGFIRRSTYSQLTGRLKDMALKDLSSFKEQGLIDSKGRGNQMYFVKAGE